MVELASMALIFSPFIFNSFKYFALNTEVVYVEKCKISSIFFERLKANVSHNC